MYQEIILILLIISVLVIYILNVDTRISVEAFNKKKYKVKNDNTKINKIKADFLARIDIKIRKLIEYMNNNNLPSKEIANRLKSRYNKLGETINGEKDGAAYAQNKGEIFICLVTKGKLNDENDTFFVCLHELAHLMSNSYGHGEEFKTNFNYIVKLAVKLNFWKDPRYEEKSVDYCGVQVTNSPCSDGKCNENALDKFFKSSLLDD